MDNGAINYRRFRDKEDKNALIEIIKEYKDDLMYFLYSNVRDINVAEDLTEDTFVLLGTKKPKDKQDCSFKTWLYTIGRNLAIDYLRKRLLFTASQAVIVTGFANENRLRRWANPLSPVVFWVVIAQQVCDSTVNSNILFPIPYIFLSDRTWKNILTLHTNYCIS